MGLGNSLLVAILGLIIIVVFIQVIQDQSKAQVCAPAPTNDVSGGTLPAGTIYGVPGNITVAGVPYTAGTLCYRGTPVAGTGVGYFLAPQPAGGLYGPQHGTTRTVLFLVPVIAVVGIMYRVWKGATKGSDG